MQGVRAELAALRASVDALRADHAAKDGRADPAGHLPAPSEREAQ